MSLDALQVLYRKVRKPFSSIIINIYLYTSFDTYGKKLIFNISFVLIFFKFYLSIRCLINILSLANQDEFFDYFHYNEISNIVIIDENDISTS